MTSPQISIIPSPTRIKKLRHLFRIGPETRVLAESGSEEVAAIASEFAEKLRTTTCYPVPLGQSAERLPAENSILLTTVGGQKSTGREGYEIVVRDDWVLVRAPEPRGVFLGAQTLRQLLPPEVESPRKVENVEWKIPGVWILDQPRYPCRGLLIDCARHFMTKEFLKRYIDLLACHKLNRLHLHLTDDQGWRIEIKKRPKLTEVGAWRGKGDEKYGGFYTQDDIREIVAYAESRYVVVIPEIEMPGHARGALASYPEISCTGGPFEVATTWGVFEDVFCAGNDETFEFLEDVLDEVMELFPSSYIHIGGDECPKKRWQACEKCQARMQAEGLKDERELQSYFVKRISKILESRGRRLIGWDEILEGGLAPGATVQSWRGVQGGVAAARAGHDVIMSPTSHCYFDYGLDAIDLRKVFFFEPTPPELTPEEAKHILGGQANMWTEYAPQETIDGKVFPRLLGLAETLWSPAEGKDFDEFHERVKAHCKRLDFLGVRYGAAFAKEP
ncbi:MAG TPA: beta-N-acetylhexosaminidase [Sumerlaeia bacterium]|nr:beta-N-acetylhexosaminidase [Sumerlaeia bacterium]